MTTTPRQRFRMPVSFGPAPGPRQKSDGSLWTLEETGTMRQEFLSFEFVTREDQLQALLPPGFVLRGEPVVTVLSGFFRDLYWLAGRGYGILHPLIPVTYHGRDETIEGNYMPVIWEGLADAVITGRDELGFPKLPADFSALEFDPAKGTARSSASWLDFEFFSAEAHDLVEVPGARPPAPAPNLTFKYVPRTSSYGSEGADIAEVTTGANAEPPSGDALDAAAASKISYRRWEGSGELAWHPATFAQLPTTHHVVNGLAALDVVEFRSAAYYELTLPGLLVAGAAEQRSVAAAEDNRFVQFPAASPPVAVAG